MRFNSRLALKAGILGTVISVGAAILTPLAGAVACGMWTWGAVSTMGTAAAVSLTAAGAAGGYFIGRFVSPIVVFGGLAASALLGWGAGAIAGSFGKVATLKKAGQDQAAKSMAQEEARKLADASAKPGFDSATVKGTAAKAQAAPVSAPKITP